MVYIRRWAQFRTQQKVYAQNQGGCVQDAMDVSEREKKCARGRRSWHSHLVQHNIILVIVWCERYAI